MSGQTLRAFIVRKQADGRAEGGVERISVDALPESEVLFRVAYSSLNYKDALSVSGNQGVTKNYPHIPGIDSAGEILASTTPEFKPGQKIIVTGYEFGANAWGGYGELARVPAEWVTPVPDGLSLREAMILGTAGFTAAQCAQTLSDHRILPPDDIVVTGATGGVGSIAVMLLARLGYRVTAVSGKPHCRELLRRWGATETLPREALDDRTNRPLLKARIAGAVDTVGGATLGTILRSTRTHGCVTACGLVGGEELNATVYPFILRGITLSGITSAWSPKERRLEIWRKLAGDWKPPGLEEHAIEIGLDQITEWVAKMFAGDVVGRVLVKVSGDY